MEMALEKREEVAMSNCTVKKRKGFEDDDLEIVVGTKCNLIKSPKKFCFDQVQLPLIATITISSLCDIPVAQRVNIVGKVLRVKPVEQVRPYSGSALQKEDVIVADSTGSCRCVAWESNIGRLEAQHSYSLKNLIVRSFKGDKFLSLSDSSSIEDVGDIGETHTDHDIDSDERGKIDDVTTVNGEISEVQSCDEYKVCRKCNAKVTETSKIIGECSNLKCGSTTKLTRCADRKVVRMVLEDKSGIEYAVTAFDDIVTKIIDNASDGNTTKERLLCAPLMTFTITNKIISSVVL